MKLSHFSYSHRSSSFSPWLSPTLRTRSDGGDPSSGDDSRVLLVDDRMLFRQAVASGLMLDRVEVIQATGVYDALRLIHRRAIALVVIRGNLRSQSGWGCAAKLCGAPPWRGVILHFDCLTDQSRKWARASGVTGLAETCGRPEKLVATVQRVFSAASDSAALAAAS